LWAGLPVISSCYAGCASELLPKECIFDTLVPESIDAAIRWLMTNNLQNISKVKLRVWQDVASQLGNSLTRSVQRKLIDNV
jgi:hypothetical protein